VHDELRFAKRHCQHLRKAAFERLRELLLQNHLSIASGDLVFLESGW